MTKEELFRKYHIDESHSVWQDSIDNWMSIEVYRLMHNGGLPKSNDLSVKWVTDFLDKTKEVVFVRELMKREDWGSLYLTAKRMVYRYSAALIKE